MSHIQALMRRYVAWYFPFLMIIDDARPTARPNQYNRTGRALYNRWGIELQGLEIDIWLPQIRVAIEVQGGQHYRPVDRFHADVIRPTWWQRLLGAKPRTDRRRVQERFQAQLQRDARKRTRLTEQGVLLITLDHADRLHDRLRSKIRQVATWGVGHANDPAIRHRLTGIDWTRKLPAEWMAEWDRLASARPVRRRRS